MKSLLAFSIVLLTILSCNSFTSPISYNDKIIKPQLEVVSKLDSIFEDENVSVEKIKKHRLELVSIVEDAMTDVKNLEDYKGNNSFKESGMKYLAHLNLIYNKTANIDSLIYNFNSVDRIEKMSEKDYNFMEAELKKYLELENNLLAEQKKFAQQFNMKLDY